MKRKIVIWSMTFIMLIACITTSTYAWFQLNEDGWVSSFDFKLDVDEGIYISVDGNNYSENLTSKQIMSTIIKQVYSEDWSYNKAGELIDSDKKVISDDDIKAYYNKIALDAITSLDGENFKDYYNSDLDATNGKYYSFVFYLKLANPTTEDDVEIRFVESDVADQPTTKLESEAVDYVYRNEFYSFDKTTYETIHYSPAKITDESGNLVNPTISVNAKDAMRFSTVVEYETINDEDVVEIETVRKIYELYEGLGSYATTLDSSIEGFEHLAKYDATKNAGFTLLNKSIHTDKEPLNYEDLPDIYETISSESVCVLTKDNNFEQKVTINLWLEGYDADCFNGIGSSKIKVQFAFAKGGNE